MILCAGVTRKLLKRGGTELYGPSLKDGLVVRRVARRRLNGRMPLVKKTQPEAD